MNCKLAEQKMQELLDGDLPGPLREELLRHFKECENCRRSYQTLLALAGELKRSPLPEPGAAFKAALLSKLGPETAEPARLSDLFTASALLMSPVLAVFVLQFFATGNLGTSILSRLDELSAWISTVPALENLKLTFLMSYGYDTPHIQSAAFIVAVTALILICQAKPHRIRR